MSIRKVASLAAVLRRDPAEFADRVAAIAEGRLERLRIGRPTYVATDWASAAAELSEVLGSAVVHASSEPALQAVERHVHERLARLRGSPLDDGHNGDMVFGRCCYAVTRALRPAVAIETGVGHGVSTTFILAALHANGSGELHSIDMPPHDRGAESQVGACVPQQLREHWQLHRGMSRRVLPRLLAELPAVDLFVHDSQHTWRNMRFEFDAVWPGVSVIIADDVEQNDAFAALMRRSPAASVVVEQADKAALFGVLVR
jgi:hypothetical protein